MSDAPDQPATTKEGGRMKLAPLLGPAVLGAVASRTADFPLPEALKLARDWGIVVVLIWLIWYGVTVFVPRMGRQQADTIKALADRFGEELKAERDQRQAMQSRVVDLLEKHLPKE
jgi:hypothetical protein